jgi:cyclic pyranopterin phosphate synthase
VAAGLARVNVSVDSLDPDRFARITRRDDLGRVLAGLAACERHPALRPIKVNAVALRGLSEPDVLPLAELARRRPYVVRFIEVMPLDAPGAWRRADVLSGAELRGMIGARWPLEPLAPERPSATATRWRFADGAGELQFVASVTEPFCATCDRLRLTADGQLRTCLFAETETDLRGPLRAGADDEEITRIITAAVAGKGPGHGMADPEWRYAGRPMSLIGG